MTAKSSSAMMGGTNSPWTKILAAASVILLIGAASKIYKPSVSPESPNKLRGPSLFTPSFSAVHDENVLNVHVVSHTHDDVGWLKTVEQYFYGRNNSIRHAHVKAILDTIMEALVDNPNRTFTYVEQKFFSMWWNEQTPELHKIVQGLVDSHQLTFVNGGWCMHDEASTHFMGMIDQTTLGHAFLKEKLGVLPTVGWQLDPFGHSSTQASTSSLFGFDALYFGRIDYQDLNERHNQRECEGLWDASSSGIGDPVFWGLTGSYGGNYGAPPGFCFDVLCDDDPLVGWDHETLVAKINTFATDLAVQSNRTKGNHIMVTMGSDFQYQEAKINFQNLDLLIHSIHKFQDSKELDIPSLFGRPYEKVNIFYSNPEFYTNMKHEQTMKQMKGERTGPSKGLETWSTKTDDFFPYADGPHAYWTGYFTSRTAFKRLERVGSSFLLAARQIESKPLFKTGAVGMGDCKCNEPLYDLEDGLGVSQHHDGVSGTAKQHVSNDYAAKVQAGINKAQEYAGKKIKKLLLKPEDTPNYLNDLTHCQLLNETVCEISEVASRDQTKDLYIVVYNALGSRRSVSVGIPVSAPGTYITSSLHDNLQTVSVSLKCSDKLVVYFNTGPLAPTGGKVFRMRMLEDGPALEPETLSAEATSGSESTEEEEDVLTPHKSTVSNGLLSVEFDRKTGLMGKIQNLLDGSSLVVNQEWGYYTSFDWTKHGKPDQNSGAYIFRPSDPNERMTPLKPLRATQVNISGLLQEIRVEFEQPWVSQVTRLYDGGAFVEVEYTVGPVPVDDGIGKEIVTRYSSSISSDGVFYTDSNGREFQRRERSSRPTWKLEEFEPVAGNFYPVNAAAYIEDDDASMALVVDRSLGGSSLVDGSIELMVQRRIVADDSRGVGEPLNETVGGVAPYPPYGDASRIGDGVVVKGKHRLVVGKGKSGASLARSNMDEAFSEPLVFVASESTNTRVPFQKASFSLMKDPLPPNVMLVTFMLLPKAPKTTFLIRLGHQYGVGEHEELSKPVSVCLFKVVGGHNIISIVEKTLSGNQDYNAWIEKRLRWDGVNVAEERHLEVAPDGGCFVELKPMEIRTFEVQVDMEG